MRERATGHLWAIKNISRGEQITDHVMREIVNHRNLRHPFVVHFKEVLVTETHLCVVMEYIGKGGVCKLDPGLKAQHPGFSKFDL